MNAYVANDPVNATDPTGRQAAQVQNPIAGGEGRGCDDAGCGEFGAARGNRDHNGFDIAADVGEDVLAPIDGTVRVITAIYANDDPDFDGVEITNDDESVKLFYVEPSVETGDEVDEGDVVGTVQAIAEEHGNGMENHIHMEVRQDGNVVDPEPLIED